MTAVAMPPVERASLLTKIAARYSVEPNKMLGTSEQIAERNALEVEHKVTALPKRKVAA